MNERFSHRIARLLGLANSDPCVTGDKVGFYQLKQAICEQYGKRDGEDIQQIKRDCWDCGGTGRDSWGGGYYCSRCDGDGVYEWVYVRLERWKVGRSVFHCPVGRIFDSAIQREANIKGLVKHRRSPLALESAIALAKLFSESLYWKWLKYSPPRGFGKLVHNSARLAEMVGKHSAFSYRLEHCHCLMNLTLPAEG